MPATGDRGGQPPVETWSLQILTLRSGSGRPASTPSGFKPGTCLPWCPWVVGQRGGRERFQKAEMTPPEDTGTGGLTWVRTGDLLRVAQL